MEKDQMIHVEEKFAGRDLDREIAEKVMGWTEDPEGCWLDKNNEYTDTGYGTEQNTFHFPVWKPSTDIAAAWAIIETFRHGWQGHAAACIDIKVSDWVNHPDCQVSIFGPDIAEVKTEAYSICLAICRASLEVALLEEKCADIR